MFFKVVSINYKKSIQKAVTTFMSFNSFQVDSSTRMGIFTKNMHSYYTKILLDICDHIDGLSLAEAKKINLMVQSFVAYITGYLQVDSPTAFPENGFFPQRGYARGRGNQEAFLNFLNNAGFRFNGEKFKPGIIYINRKFIDNFQNKISIDARNTTNIDKHVKEQIKDFLSNQQDISGNDFFVELIFSNDKEIAQTQKKVAMNALSQYLKGFQVKDYNLLAFEYGKNSGLLTLEPLMVRGHFDKLKDLLSRHGAILDARVLADSVMREVVLTEELKGITHSQFNSAAKFFNTKQGRIHDETEAIQKLLTDYSSEDISALDDVQFVKHLTSALVKQVLSDVRNNQDEMSELQKEFVVGILKRISEMLKEERTIQKASTDVKQERLKYLLIAEELAILHAVFDNKKSLEQYLAEDSILDVPGLRRNSFVYNSGMSALSEIMQEVKSTVSKNISVTIDENIYYEMPDMFRDIFGSEQTIEKFAYNNGLYGDVAFFDLHPNNPNSVLIKSVTTQKIIDDLSGVDFEKREKALILIIDVSTHGMYDGEVLELLNAPSVSKLVSDNKLVVVTLQSLAKFGSLGTDKFNGAIINVYDSGQNKITDTMQQRMSVNNVVRGSIADRYFYMLFSLGSTIHNEFVKRARANAILLYSKLREKNEEKELKFLQENQDPKLIYVSLKYMPYFDSYMKDGVVSETAKKSLFYKISVYLSRARQHGLLINTRSGFGFIESAVSCCGDSLRLMVGAGESEESLKQYVELLLETEEILNESAEILAGKKSMYEVLSEDRFESFYENLGKSHARMKEILVSNNLDSLKHFIKKVERSNNSNDIKQKVLLYLELYRIWLEEQK